MARLTVVHQDDVEIAEPFKDFAQAYVRAGWPVFPLPPGEKFPPPTRVTGRFPVPSPKQITAWIRDCEPGSNLGIRMPPHVIGIDVDDYSGKHGGQTITDIEEQIGMKLPATWTLSSRDDGASGIRFYIVQAGLQFKSVLGNGVEVIQHRHRYAVGSPSIHPDTGKRYLWYKPGQALDGSGSTDVPNFPQGRVKRGAKA